MANTKHQAFDWAQLLIPTAIFIGVILRFWGAAGRPIDGDEGLILSVASGSIGHVLATAAHDVHPPLFHLLTSLSLALFGVNRLALRLISIMAGIGVVSLAPALARRLKINPVVTTFVITTAPFLVYVSQDARMYSLLMLLALGSYLALMDAWDKPTEWQRWIVWGVSGLLLVLTHHLGWVILASEGVATLLFARKSLAKLYHWLGAVGIILVGYWPVYLTTIHQFVGRLGEQATGAGLGERATSFIGAAYRTFAGRTFLSLSPHNIIDLARTNPLYFVAFLGTLAVPVVLFVLGAQWLYRRDNRTAWIWATLAVIPIIVAAGVGSIAIQASRYLSFLAPVVLSLVAVGLVAVYPRWWGKLLAIIFAGTVVAGLWTQIAVHDRAPGMNTYAAALRTSVQSNDIVVVRGSFGGGESTALAFEAKQAGFALPTVVDMFGDYSVGNLATLRAVAPATVVDQLLLDHSRVWFFDDTYEPTPLLGLDHADSVTTQSLGVDKEQQPLTLYRVTK